MEWIGKGASLACALALAACGEGTGPVPTANQPLDTLDLGAVTVAAGGNGSVAVAVAGGGARTVAAGNSQTFSVPAGSTSRLTANPVPGYGFADWNGACAGSANPVCVLSDGERVAARFEPVACVMTLSSGPGGSMAFAAGDEDGTVSAGGRAELSVTIESELALAAAPAAGYAFAGWDGDCASPAHALICNDFPGTAFYDGRLSVHARFAPAGLTLTVTAGPGGSVAVSVGGSVTTVAAGESGEFAVDVEAPATLAAAPAPGYAFEGWDGECAGQPAGCELAAGALTADASARAVFEAVPTTLAVTAGPGGSVAVSVAGSVTTVAAGSSGEFAVDVETPAALAAAPAPGYAFEGWDGDCADAAGPACAFGDAAFDGGISAAARFAPAGLTLTVEAGRGGSVAVSVAGSVTTVAAGSSGEFAVDVETPAALAAAPAPGYAFEGWDGECAGQPAGCGLAEGALTADASARAVFEAVPTTLAVTAGPGGSVAVSVAGSVTTVAAGSSGEFAVDVETPAALAAAPAPGYAFEGWDGDCADAAGPACAFADAAFDGGISAAARFAPAGLTLTVEAGRGGSVAVSVAGSVTTVAAGSSGEFAVDVETPAALAAAPAPGYAFEGWDGECAGQPAGCGIAEGALTADASARAVFEAVPTTLAVAAGPGGSVAVSVAGSVTTVAAGSSGEFAVDVEAPAALAAAPAPGYAFEGWDGDCADAAGPACAFGDAAFDGGISAAARFAPAGLTLTVEAGRGGSVAVSVAGSVTTVAAGSSGEFAVDVETPAALAAAPAPGYAFEGWDGECAGQPAGCGIAEGALTADASARAVFEAVPTTLAVTAGPGGSVAVSVAGSVTTVAAGESGEFSVDVEAPAALAAAPAPGYAFEGWDGDCADAAGPACAFADAAFDGGISAAARFAPAGLTLTVGAGRGGSVAVSVAGSVTTVAAGSSRGFSVTVETPAALAAAPAPGYAFEGWDGECAGQPAGCGIAEGALTADASARAVFEAVPTTLAVAAGPGGSVAVSVAGSVTTVAAGESGEFSVDVEAPAALAAAPAPGYAFEGWDGDCAGADGPACAFGDAAFDGGISAAARFAPAGLTLTVEAGRGGSVAVSVGGSVTTVAAGSSRGFSVTVETPAALAAAPAPGWRFGRWDGECAGQPAGCGIAAGALTADASARAVFEAVPTTLAVAAGPGGSVAVSVGGSVTTVAAGESREFAVDVEAPAALAAAPAPGYAFEGWDGDCADADGPACAFGDAAFDGGISAAARFAPAGLTLTVGAGRGGSVAVSVAGSVTTVAAGSSGEFAVDVETPAALAAAPAPGYAFEGWDGECAGQPAGCGIAAGALTADASARAVFEAVPTTLAVAAGPGGSVAVSVAGSVTTVAAGSSGEFSVDVEAPAALAAAPAPGYAFEGWDGDCADAAGPACAFADAAFDGGISAAARFAPAGLTLTVGAGRGGSVAVSVGGSVTTVAAGSSRGFSVTVETPAALAAEPAPGYAFEGWDGECAGQPAGCGIAAGALTADASAKAVFEAVPTTLTVAAGPGGSVAVSVAGSVTTVAAGSSRGFPVTVETPAALAAAPAPGWRFGRWEGECAGQPAGCGIAAGALTADASARAVFEAVPTTLAVAAGPGGSVAVSVAGSVTTVAAGESGEFSVDVETPAALAAAPAPGYAFEGWDGDCADAAGPACAFADAAFDGGISAAARFAPAGLTLTVGAGRGGSVAVSVAGSVTTVAAGSSRGFPVTVETPAALAAAPAPGYAFEGWDGECAGQPAGCGIAAGALTADASARAVFEAVPTTLAVAAGPGGSVAVSVGGSVTTVAAGESREFAVDVEAPAALAAAPAPGYAFEGWDGDCAGADGPACAFGDAAFDGGISAAARFAPAGLTLTVGAGRGGSVAVSVGGSVTTVAAGSSRGFSVTVETPAALAAAPAPGWRFGRWEGECAGQPAGCGIAAGALTADASARAVFEAVPTTLAVAAGPGGSVAVSVAGSVTTVAAGESGEFAVDVEAPATLAAGPAPGYAFEGWDGDCADAAGPACAFADAAFDGGISAAARFAPAGLTLTVEAGRGGSVAVSVAGSVTTVAAGSSGEFAVDVETPAALAAAPAPGYAFEGWDGECAGQPAGCGIAEGALTADASARAVFEAVPTTLAVAAGPGGSVAVSVAGSVTTVAAGESREFAVDVEAPATLAAAPAPGYAFEGWDGDCADADGPACAFGDAAFDGGISAAARFAPAGLTLTVGAGRGGSVAVSVAGSVTTVAAGSSRGFPVTVETPAALAAAPAPGYAFEGWDGECAGQPAGCGIAEGALTADASARAVFEAVPTTLAVAAGPGGSVAVSVAGSVTTVAAGESREFAVDVEAPAALAAAPAPGYAFEGWDGDCAGADGPACAFGDAAFDGGISAAARFAPAGLTLTVGAGRGGSVAVSVAGSVTTVAAGSSRGFPVTVEASAALAAAPAPGWRFGRWEGECAGQGAGCGIAAGALTADASARAVFEAVPTTLAVAAGPGGSVAVSVGGSVTTVAAGESREFAVDVEAPAALAAAPAPGYAFEGWDGDCAGTAGPACAFGDAAFDGGISAAARFAPAGLTLTVGAGRGGSVAVSVGGSVTTVAAGSSRGFPVTVETPAALAAAPAPGWRFGRWEGECAGQGAGCGIAEGALTADASARAVFEAVPTTLAVAAGPGGSVAVSVGGSVTTVAAGESGEFAVDVEAPAALAAAPAPGYAFEGWGGDCADAAGPACAFADAAFDGGISAAARFAPAGLTLTVEAGRGGSVAVSVAGSVTTVAAGSSRGFPVTVETPAALAAAPAPGYAFEGWDGECAGQPAGCGIAAGALTADASARAVFEAVPTTLAVAAGPGGSVAVSVAGSVTTVAAGESREFAVDVEAPAALAAAPAPGYAFEGWDGDCADAAGPACAFGDAAFDGGISAAARFAPAGLTLTVEAGRGGSVAVSVAGSVTTVAAGSSRGFPVTVETPAALAAAPAPGWRFGRWEGECAGQGAGCGLAEGALTADASARAVFEAVPTTLAVAAGPGGSVAVSVAGSVTTVAAGESREFAVDVEAPAALAAAPAPGYAFEGWDGDCADADGPACAFGDAAFDGGISAAARFAPAGLTLTVEAGRGGSVAVSVAGSVTTVAAGSSGEFAVDVETPAALAAAPAPGWRFGRWEGECAGQGAGCGLAEGALTADASARAVFEAVPTTLAVAAGPGGSVAVSVGGSVTTVAAGESREFAVDVEAPATLAAAPAPGYAFEGWGGDCAGADGPACGFGDAAFDGGISAAARFAPAGLTLTVEAGRGGSVAVSVAGSVTTVAAGESREFAVDVETPAALAAAPAPGWRFGRWEGECAGQGAGCGIAAGALTADASARAAFEAVPTTLAVTAGPGGSVAVSVAGSVTTVAAGESGEFAVDVETPATLKAVPAPGYAFEGWDGECAGQPARCELAEGALGADASAEAAFEPAVYRLSVTATGDGWVDVSFTDGVFGIPVDATVLPGPDNIGEFLVSARDPVELAPLPFTGWHLGRWEGECAGQPGACELPAGALAADAFVTARFERTTRTLTASAAEHGAVRVTIGTEVDETVPAGSSATFSVFVGRVGQLLEAMPDAHYRFSRWTGACAGAGPVCELPREAFAADMAATALFAPATYTLTVSSGRGGSVLVSIDGGAGMEVLPESERAFAVSVETEAVMATVPANGYRFERWAGECAGRPAECGLPPGALIADASAAAAFEAVPTTLTVAAGPNGSVAVSVAGSVTTVAAGSSREFAVDVETSATLTAGPSTGWRFAGWTGAPCAGASGRVCEIPASALAADAFVEAGFAELLTWIGPGLVTRESTILLATPYARGAFLGWQGEPCDGSAATTCAIPSLPQDAAWPVAAFRPFVVDGVKSLLFGLNYHALPPSHFMVSLREAPGAVFSAVPGLGELSPGLEPARLAVSVHLLPWGSHGFFVGYMTEACDDAGSCAQALGGLRTLEQAESVAVTGHFKAPNAAADDEFAAAVALSADGGTLAVGARFEESSATGAFAPSDPGWEDALDDDQRGNSGAVYVYRRDSDGRWAVEAFVKAPVADASDRFGSAAALSADGAVLVVGAPFEDSSTTGAFVPSDPGWEDALDDDQKGNSGAAYVYRRDSSGHFPRWAVEAFIKAPVADADDRFGGPVALSADGGTLALIARGEDSPATGVFAPSDQGWADALNGVSRDSRSSGAAYVYRRGSDGRWDVEAFIKAPVADTEDGDGAVVSLSADGRTLAVGAPEEDSSHNGNYAPSDGSAWTRALGDDGATNSGAVYVYRRDSGGRWAVEAFIKATLFDAQDNFGAAVALSADGLALAVGAPGEDSSAAGVFAPESAGYADARLNDDASASGAAYVFRRNAERRWPTEAFIKAPATLAPVPAANADDGFGAAVALSADGGVLAVGAPGEDSSVTGVFVRSGLDWSDALIDDTAAGSGASSVYRRESGDWTVKTFVKASNTGAGDEFGGSVALSDDGGTLAVGAPSRDAAAGAAYLY